MYKHVCIGGKLDLVGIDMSDLCKLMKGRDYMDIIYAEGDSASDVSRDIMNGLKETGKPLKPNAAIYFDCNAVKTAVSMKDIETIAGAVAGRLPKGSKIIWGADVGRVKGKKFAVMVLMFSKGFGRRMHEKQKKAGK